MALTAESWRALSSPRTIAIVGATDRATPTNFTRRFITSTKNIGFKGKLVFVNPSRETVYNEKCWPSISALPEAPDAVAVSVPGSRVIGAVRDGINAGAKAFLIHSGGFGERGSAGIAMQKELQALCNDAQVACLGPNCLGIVSFSNNSAFCAFGVPGPREGGTIAAISQSGAVAGILTHITNKYGLSFIASTGNEAVTTMEDLIGCGIDDPNTKMIVAFVEALRRPREIFDLAARAHQAGKPIIMMKVGLTDAGGKVSYGHTGALTGSGAVYRQALAQAGVVMVDDFDELAQTVELFAMLKKRPKRVRLGILGTSGGELSGAADRAVEVGLPLPKLSAATEKQLQDDLRLPADLIPLNPVDVGTSYENPASYHDRMRMSIRAVAADESVEMLAVLQGFNRDNADMKLSLNSEMLSAGAFEAPELDKPVIVIASQAGRADAEILRNVTAAQLPALEGTREAMHALAHLDRFLQYRPETLDRSVVPVAASDVTTWDDGAAAQADVFKLLERFAVPAAKLRRVASAAEAEATAREFGGAVVMKVDTPKIVHKSDVGGVVLGVTPETAAKHFEALKALVEKSGDPQGGVVMSEQLPAGVEFFVGATQDASFGPVIACGIGGRFLELLGKTALLVPPISQRDALAAIERSGAKPFLDGYRGGPQADFDGLAAIIVKVGKFAAGLGDALEELDLNPIIVSNQFPAGRVADARLKLRR